MLITVDDLERETLEYDTTILPGIIDFGPDITQMDPLVVVGEADVIEEHRGPKEVVQDIRLRGSYRGRFTVACARCIDPVEQTIASGYDLIFRPSNADANLNEHSIGASETEIGYYDNGSLMLEDVLREQVLLSLPARTLCREDCKGLCPRCGGNQNIEPCTCDALPADPRWSALSDLRSRIKTN